MFFYDSHPIFDIFRHKTRLFHGGIGVSSPNAQHDSPQKMGQGRANMAGKAVHFRQSIGAGKEGFGREQAKTLGKPQETATEYGKSAAEF